jgi:hypothetical protein
LAQTAGLPSIHFCCPVDFMKTLCAAVLLATLSLGGCCLSGSGCDAPMAAATTGRYDLDGLGQPPAEDPPSQAPKQRVSSRRGQGDEPRPVYDNINAGDNFDDDDARLRRKLIICQGCAVSGH